MSSKNRNPVRLLLYLPVPWVYVLIYLVALIPHYLIPISIHSAKTVSTLKISGAVFFSLGAVLAAWSLIIFHRAHTTTTPGESSQKLIIKGPYRLSRNPMYVSLALAYLGEAGLLAQVWPAIFLVLVISYVNWIVIPLEEEILSRDFKEEYQAYSQRVRRWL